jgi:hypothetical protein
MATNNSLNINAVTPLILAWGGSGASLTASDGGIVYSSASAMAILAGTATAGLLLTSGSNSAPSWTSASYLPSLVANEILFASATNVMAQIPAANDAVLITSNTGVPSLLANSGTPGYVLTANSGAPPSWQASSGSGTVSSGLINEMTWYAATGTVVSGLATANDGVLVTSAGGVPSISSTLPLGVQTNITELGTVTTGVWNGSILAGQYGGTGIANTGLTITLAAGALGDVLTSDSSGNATWAPNSVGITWVDQTSTPATMVANTGYVTDDGATLIVYTLPSAPVLGTIERIAGFSAGGWELLPGAGDTIQIGSVNAATSVSSANQYDCIEIVYTVGMWVMLSSVGNGFVIV